MIFKRIKNLWKLSSFTPVSGGLLENNKDTVILQTDKEIKVKRRPATVVADDPLEIFPTEK